MANTTWSTTDKTNVTLSGSNLIATATGNGGVRGKDPKRSGKFYIEFTCTTWTTNTAIGLCYISTPFATSVQIAAIGWAVGLPLSGNVYIGGTGNLALGSRASGNVIGLAVDLDARLIWFRVAPAGNWNGSATADPAAGVGGFSLASVGLGGGFDAYPFAELAVTNDSVTANFGDTAFSGTVPSGFTSGWDDSASPLSNVVTTQIAAEVWGQTNPAMETTQIAAEVWGAPNTWLAESGIVRETLYATTGTLRTAGMVREVLRPNAGDSSPSITGVAGTGQLGVVQMLPVATTEFKVQQRNVTAYEDEQLAQEWSDLQRLRNYRSTWQVGANENVSKFVQYDVLTTPPAAVAVSKLAQYDVLSIPNASLSVSKAVQYVVIQPTATTVNASVTGVGGTGQVGTLTATISSQTTLTGVAGTGGAGTVTPEPLAASGFTIWNTTDRVNTTLDGTHLVATASSSTGGVRALSARQSGKYYFECTLTTMTGTATSVGIAAFRATLSTLGATPTAAAVVRSNGQIWLNGVTSGLTVGSPSAGSVICIAIDLDNGYIWFRLGAAGTWNGVGGANPATTTSGLSIARIGLNAGYDVYPVATWGANLDVVTANFGASAFTGTAPAGFTSGITQADITTNVVATQIGAEVFYSPNNAAVQLTQIGAEVFYAESNPQYQLTQVGFEVWANSAILTYNVTQVGFEIWASATISPTLTGVQAFGSAGQPFGTGIPNVTCTGSVGSLSDSIQVTASGVQGSGVADWLAGARPLGVSGTGAAGTCAPPPSGPVIANATGVAGTSAAGTASTEIDLSLTGVVGASAAGTVTGQPATSVSIAGVAGTAASGTVSIEIDVTTAGTQASGQAGTLISSLSVTVTDVAATGQVGTLIATFGESVTITGVAASGQAGDLVSTYGGLAGLTGDSGTGQIGTVGREVDVALTGVTGTGQAPDLIAGISFDGVEGDGAAGSLTAIFDSNVVASGASGTGATGTFGKEIDVTFSGVSGTGQAPDLIAGISFDGVQGDGAAGILSLTFDSNKAITGRSGTGHAGTVSKEIDVSVAGVSGTGLAGVPIIIYGPIAYAIGVEGASGVGTFAKEIDITFEGVEGEALLGDVTPDVLRIFGSQIARETLLSDPLSTLLAGQVARETLLADPIVAIRASQVAREVLLHDQSNPYLLLSEVVREALVNGTAFANITSVQVSGIVLETLIHDHHVIRFVLDAIQATGLPGDLTAKVIHQIRGVAARSAAGSFIHFGVSDLQAVMMVVL